MRAWKKTLLALLATGIAVIASGLDPGTAFAADPRQPAKPQPRAQATQPRPLAGPNAAVVTQDPPDFLETWGALAGGLLAIGLAAFGLTITFRSLAADVKGRRHRYRRRVRRSPRAPADA